jgi:putative ABC transport system substrate-binding protein
MFKELTPNAKTIGIVYCSAEANSVYQAEVIAEELKALGFETKDFTASETNDIAQVVQAACDACDALYIPTDNTMASATGTIEPIVTKANIPVIAGEEGICKGCAVATLSISYHSIGYNAGLMAYEILVNGADPATMDIKVPTKDDVVFKYVPERATALGLTIPDNYEAMDINA